MVDIIIISFCRRKPRGQGYGQPLILGLTERKHRIETQIAVGLLPKTVAQPPQYGKMGSYAVRDPGQRDPFVGPGVQTVDLLAQLSCTPTLSSKR